MKILVGQPTQARPCIEVCRITSLMSSTLLSQNVLFVLLEWFTRWEVSGWTAVELLDADLRIYSNHLVPCLCSSHLTFSSCISLVSWCNTDTAADWKKSRFILLKRSDVHVIDNLLEAVQACAMRVLASIFVDMVLLSRYVNWSTDFRGFFICIHVEADATCYLL